MNFTWLGAVAVVILVVLIVFGYHRGFIKELVSILFIFLSMVIVWMINPYVNQFLRENTSIEKVVNDNLDEFVDQQIANSAKNGNTNTGNDIIENLMLPQNMKDVLIKNNNSETYGYLNANSLVEYVKDYLSESIINGISFILSYALATLLIRILAYILDILSHLPIIHGANKILGALLGGVKGVLFIWLGLLILTVICNTAIGEAGMMLVDRDFFLTILNKYNVFVKVFMSVIY